MCQTDVERHIKASVLICIHTAIVSNSGILEPPTEGIEVLLFPLPPIIVCTSSTYCTWNGRHSTCCHQVPLLHYFHATPFLSFAMSSPYITQRSMSFLSGWHLQREYKASYSVCICAQRTARFLHEFCPKPRGQHGT